MWAEIRLNELRENVLREKSEQASTLIITLKQLLVNTDFIKIFCLSHMYPRVGGEF